jgi:hypothetical protein
MTSNDFIGRYTRADTETDNERPDGRSSSGPERSGRGAPS